MCSRYVQLLRLFLFFSLVYINRLVAQEYSLKFNHITSENGLPQNTIHGIAKDKYGFMWFGTWAGLCRYDGYDFKVYRFDPKNKRTINSNRVHNVLKDSDGNIWVLTFKDQQLCRYNYETDDFDRFSRNSIKPGFIRLIARREHFESVKFNYKQFQWNMESASNSLVQTDLRSNKKTYFNSNPSNRWSLNDPYVTDLFKDDENLLWVGTYSNGINKANLKANPFKCIFHDPANRNSLIDNNVKTICEDKEGNVWVGTRDKGISVISKSGIIHYVNSATDINSINNNQVKKIYCDSKGIIWVGTKRGLDSFDPETKGFIHYKELGLNYLAVHNIIEDKQQNLWLATWRGIYQYKRNEKRFIHYDPDKTLMNQHAKVLLLDSKGLLWVGTEGGGLTALRYSGNNDRLMVVKHYQHEDEDSNSISDDRVNYILEDSRQHIWIGTGDGINKLDPVTNAIQQFPSPHDLGGVAAAGIAEDGKGCIWISHRKGISRINLKTLAVNSYTALDGLQGNEFSDGAVFKSSYNGKLFFGGNNGLSVFNPDSIEVDPTFSRTVLTRLLVLNREVGVNEEVNGRVILSRPFYLTPALTLTNSDKSFSIEFAGLHYANPEGIRYAYKLEGFDKDWLYTDASRRIATYSNLDAGDYTFLVRSANSNGIWNPRPTILNIRVKPPFWASIYAYVLYAFITAILLYLYHYYSGKYNQIQGKLAYELLVKEKENELHQRKLQFFTNISHEIKTPLTLILAPLEKLSELYFENQIVAAQIKTLKNSGERLLRLVNQLLDFRKLETGNVQLNVKKKNIVQFIRTVIDPFKVLAESRNVNLTFSSRKTNFYLRFDEDKFEKVISNLVSNAIRFTINDGYIDVRFRVDVLDDRELAILEVVNLGKEVPPGEKLSIFEPFMQGSGNSEGGTGLGLAFSKALVELHGGGISVNSIKIDDLNFETCFRVELPVNTVAVESFEIEDEKVEGTDIAESAVKTNNDLSRSETADIHKKNAPFLLDGRLPLLLIVEDNADLRTYLKEHLESFFLILEAENGCKGLEAASRQLPDLILSDIMMPEMDGMEFCRRVKTSPDTAHIPVVLLTAKTPIESQIEGYETGADDYILKPFNLNLLTSRVKNILLSRRQLKEKYRKAISFEPSHSVPVSPDEKLLQKVLKYIEERISDPNLNVEEISREIGLSRAQLYRKIKALTGLSMAEVIKEIRFKRAKQLLQDRKFNVNEVVYMVGFTDVDYFRKCFKAEFGITPSEFYKNKETESKLENS